MDDCWSCYRPARMFLMSPMQAPKTPGAATALLVSKADSIARSHAVRSRAVNVAGSIAISGRAARLIAASELSIVAA